MTPRLDALQARRLRLHRLDPSRPLRDARAAAAFVRERQMVLSTGRSSLPALSEAIAGRALAGSWMAHPEAGRIHKILADLRKHDFISAPLVLGKDVLMHPALGPAVERVASDRERRAQVRRRLPPLARRLLEAVETKGRVRMDHWGPPAARARPARVLLERELLVAGSEMHTEGGYHTVILRPWRTGRIGSRFGSQSRRLGYDEAADTLIVAGVRSAVVAPEREVRRWFVFRDDRVNALLAQGALLGLQQHGVPYVVVGKDIPTRC